MYWRENQNIKITLNVLWCVLTYQSHEYFLLKGQTTLTFVVICEHFFSIIWAFSPCFLSTSSWLLVWEREKGQMSRWVGFALNAMNPISSRVSYPSCAPSGSESYLPGGAEDWLVSSWVLCLVAFNDIVDVTKSVHSLLPLWELGWKVCPYFI